MTQEPYEPPVPAERVDSPGSSFGNDSLNAEPSSRLSLSGWISWIAIAAFTAFILGGTMLQQFSEQVSSTEASASDLVMINFQAEVIVGRESLVASSMFPTPPTAEDGPVEDLEHEASGVEAEKATTEEFTLPPEDLSALDMGSYEQRLCYAALRNEVEGPDAASEYLDELNAKVAEHDFERSETQVEMESSVRQLLENYRDGNLSQDILSQKQQDQLKDRLGFSGELLLCPPGSDTEQRAQLVSQSQTAAVGVILFLVMAILFFLFGIVSLLFILTYVMTGSSPSQFIATNNAHNAYVETFALWLGVFFGGQMLVGYLELLKTDAQRMIANPVFFFGSLIVLLWPILRGVPASQMFVEIGWTPKKFFRNTCLTVPAYAAWLPAMLVGIFIVFMLMQLAPMPSAGEFAVPAMPSHPAQKMLSNGDALRWITIVITACVAAPVVEETMFRGVLYRHLRGLSMTYGKAFSIIVSALVNGFIFASVHPQGILVVPALMTVAIGFSFVREWRDSLWTSVLMHALHNSTLMLIMFFTS